MASYARVRASLGAGYPPVPPSATAPQAQVGLEHVALDRITDFVPGALDCTSWEWRQKDAVPDSDVADAHDAGVDAKLAVELAIDGADDGGSFGNARRLGVRGHAAADRLALDPQCSGGPDV